MKYMIAAISLVLLSACAHVPDIVLVEKCNAIQGNPSAKLYLCKYIREIED